jgi:tetratricopeptide (TPR) repeat protein
MITATVIAMAVLFLYSGYFVAATYQRNAIYKTPVTLWRSAVNSAPYKRRTHQNYSQALSSAGMHQEALEQLQMLLALPDDGSVPLRDVHRQLGVVYFRLGMIDEAIAAWKKGLEYAYRDPGLMNNLSRALMKQQQFDEALVFAEMAVKTNPYMPEAASSLGEIYMAKGEYGKAAESFMRFVQLRPENWRGYWNASLAYERAGEYEKALRMVNQCLAMEPDPRYRQSAMQLVSSLQGKIGVGKKP